MDICGKCPDLTRQRNVPGVPIGRTEMEIDSTLPYANIFWSGNCELGQLTDLGKEKMQSGCSVLVGLSNCQPHPDVVMHMRPKSMETLISTGENCPASSAAFGKAFSTPEYAKYSAQIAAFTNRTLSILQPSSIPTWRAGMNVNDYLWLSVCHGKPLPCSSANPSDCLTAADAVTAYEHSSKQNEIIQATGNVARLFVGPFLGEIRRPIANAVNGNAKAKFELHSAHDITVYYLLSLLQKEDMSRWSVYGSNLVFEAWKNNKNGSYVVRLLYNGEVVTATKVSGLDWNAVPLDSFFKVADASTPDIATECHV
ncbi:phosphoglycerate mutase-like protein [Linderina pennispora]|uniref:Phosphoglycerate mutase-like protein n=1 Tax=Linderina pennispora TaxID=61395 RepID=A0A1Y1W0J1_9FUNG|nr:phosphoglycerate mutase-like protein [Linderina pennispora]ORX66972.1 phosphoglycerate mutase-like protein [Linderina pennispora]